MIGILLAPRSRDQQRMYPRWINQPGFQLAHHLPLDHLLQMCCKPCTPTQHLAGILIVLNQGYLLQILR